MIYDETKHSQLPKPSADEFKRVWVYDTGRVIFYGSPDEYKEFKRTTNNRDWVVQTTIDKESLAKKQIAINRENKIRENAWIQDLADYNGIRSFNKAKYIFEEAWMRSHSHGYSAVEDTFNGLVDFIGGYNKI